MKEPQKNGCSVACATVGWYFSVNTASPYVPGLYHSKIFSINEDSVCAFRHVLLFSPLVHFSCSDATTHLLTDPF